MPRYTEHGGDPPLPPRIRAAFDFLHHVRMITEQTDSSIPMRDLTPLEKSVELAALRAVQQFLLGEMDFVEATPNARRRKDDDNGGTSQVPVGTTK
jgi:hypothetical protein